MQGAGAASFPCLEQSLYDQLTASFSLKGPVLSPEMRKMHLLLLFIVPFFQRTCTKT